MYATRREREVDAHNGDLDALRITRVGGVLVRRRDSEVLGRSTRSVNVPTGHSQKLRGELVVASSDKESPLPGRDFVRERPYESIRL